MKIGIVNDLRMAAEALRRALALRPAHQVIWVANNGAQAVAMCARETPDLVLMDWAMPEMPGPVAMRRIKSDPQSPRVIILTMYDLPEYRTIAKLAHADGFVSKSDFGEKLVPLIYELFAATLADSASAPA